VSPDHLSTLLSKGYFPQELPPVFTTADTGRDARAILSEWAAGKVFEKQAAGKILSGKKKVKKANVYTYKLATPDPEVISCPKKGYERRNVQVVHPLPQGLLALEIADNWHTVVKWIARGKFSIDKVQLSPGYARGVKPLNFEAHRAKKAYIEAAADWVVRTDITRFYPSIYTHSIAWAAYGKEKVKEQVGKFSGSLADRLDILVRSGNRGQTIGIPVGPETSRIIADVISGRIDEAFSAQQPLIPAANVDRLQDDWFVGTSTLERAEAALTSISHAYRSFSLDINGSKTAVERTLSPISETWLAEIGAFLSHSKAKLTRNTLREFLHLILKLQLDYPNAPVVKYGLAVIEDKRALISDVETLESFLLRVAGVAPGAMARICSILINLQNDTKRVSIARVRGRLTELFERA
jgi:hypothetical protein